MLCEIHVTCFGADAVDRDNVFLSLLSSNTLYRKVCVDTSGTSTSSDVVLLHVKKEKGAAQKLVEFRSNSGVSRRKHQN